jgi:hypothetical protein
LQTDAIKEYGNTQTMMVVSIITTGCHNKKADSDLD